MTATEQITLAVMAERFRAHAEKDEAATDAIQKQLLEHLQNHKEALANAETAKMMAAQSAQQALLAQKSAATAVGNRRMSDRVVIIAALIGFAAVFLEPIILKMLN